MHSYLVNIFDVDIDVGGAQYPDLQRLIDRPQRLGGCFSVHVGSGGGYPPGIRWHGEVVHGQLGVQAVLCHEHQVGHPSQHYTAAHILTGTDRETFESSSDCRIFYLFVQILILINNQFYRNLTQSLSNTACKFAREPRHSLNLLRHFILTPTMLSMFRSDDN